MKRLINIMLIVATALLLLPAMRAQSGGIHDAVSAGNVETVRLLLKKDPALVNERNKRGKTPLYFAITKEVMDLLLEYGADLNARDEEKKTPVMHMTIAGFADAVELLIKRKADIKTTDDKGRTALHWAAVLGARRSAEILIAHGADVQARDGIIGGTPLHYASKGDKPDLVALLVKNKAEVNAKDDQGRTPLHDAAYLGSFETVKALVAGGAAVNAKDDNGVTPLNRALEANEKEIAKYLRQHGARE